MQRPLRAAMAVFPPNPLYICARECYRMAATRGAGRRQSRNQSEGVWAGQRKGLFMSTTRATLIAASLAVVITILSGAGWGFSFYWDNNGPFIVLAVGSAVTSFFGLLILTQKNDGR